MSDDVVDVDDTPEPPDLTPFMEQPVGLKEHPLFPLDDGVKETRDIRYVTFRRRRSDGRVDHCPEDIPASDIQSWADVVGPWGGGEYKAIGKDKHHKIVAWSPTEQGGWLLFDQPSKPFTLRDGRRYARERPTTGEAPPALTPVPTPVPAPAALGLEALLVAMVNQSAETSRTILSAVLGQKPSEPTRREMNPVEMMRAMREWVPAPAAVPAVTSPQTSIQDQLGTLKTLLELTRPQPAAPEASILGELGGLVTTVIQTDAAARASAKLAERTERRPPPARPPRLVHVPGVGIVDLIQPELAPAQAATPGAPAMAAASTQPSTPAAVSREDAASPLATVPAGVIDVETLKRNPAMVTALLKALGVLDASPPAPRIEPQAEPRGAAPPPAVPATDAPPACAPPARTGTSALPRKESAPEDPPRGDPRIATAVEHVDAPLTEHEETALAAPFSPEVVAHALRAIPGLSSHADEVAEGFADLPPSALSMLTRLFQPDDALARSAEAALKGS